MLQSPSDDLSQASLEAVRQWRYSPVLLNGQPIEVVTEVDDQLHALAIDRRVHKQLSAWGKTGR